MDKKQISLLALAVILIGAVIYLSRDWFADSNIQIGSTIRQNPLTEEQKKRFGPALKDIPYTVSFFFDRQHQLESVKVVNLREFETNRYAHPLWSLQATTNARPVKTFTYGVPLRGMRTEVAGDKAEALQPGMTYRLIIGVEGREFTHDFTLGRKSSS